MNDKYFHFDLLYTLIVRLVAPFLFIILFFYLGMLPFDTLDYLSKLLQVIPLHLPPGDMSRERTVQIEGTSEQIEAAKQLVDEVTSEVCFMVAYICDFCLVALLYSKKSLKEASAYLPCDFLLSLKLRDTKLLSC